MNLEQKRAKKILEEVGYSDFEIKKILEALVDPACLDEYGAFLDEGDDY